MKLFDFAYNPHFIFAINNIVIFWVASVFILFNIAVNLSLCLVAFDLTATRLGYAMKRPIVNVTGIALFFLTATKQDKGANNYKYFFHNVYFTNKISNFNSIVTHGK